MGTKSDESAKAAPGSVTAVNVLLELDATMREHSEASNARLRDVFPHGFALDESHMPHITLLQRFVRTADLDQIHAAAEKVFSGTDVRDVRLEAFRYYYIPGGAVGLAGIVAGPHPVLIQIQRRLIEVVAPFTVPTGDSDAFVTTPDDSIVDPMLIAYVSGFVPAATGENFNPHITTGIAPTDYLDAMLAEPFESFTFSPARAAVYQLGHFGTAARKLHDLGPHR